MASSLSPITRHPAQPRNRRGGFALPITLTLLALLVLLLVSLATFTKVETQISANTGKQAQARQNALMALNIALGQLQKFAGPDTRVTATADAFGGVSGTKHYTGVWDSAASGPTPMTSLVSGSENGTIDPKTIPGDPVTLVGTNSSGVDKDVQVQRQAIKAASVPGQAGAATIGHYAWWKVSRLPSVCPTVVSRSPTRLGAPQFSAAASASKLPARPAIFATSQARSMVLLR